LRHWLAVRIKMPLFVVGEYVVPRALKLLLDKDCFQLIRKVVLLEPDNYVFVNKRWVVPYGTREHLLEDAQAQAQQTCEQKKEERSGYFKSKRDEEEFIQEHTRDNVLKQLPHTNDAGKEIYEIIRDSEITTIISILTRK